MNSKRIIIIFVIMSSITLQAQTVDSVAFRKAAVDYIVQSIEMIKNKQCFRYNLEYADTNKIKLYIPWLKLRKPDQKEMNFQTLRQYIDERFDPYFQEVIIEKEEGIYVLSILKRIHKENNEGVSKKKWKSGIDYNTPVIFFLEKILTISLNLWDILINFCWIINLLILKKSFFVFSVCRNFGHF